MKQLLAAQELLFPELFHSLQSSIRPLLSVRAVNHSQALQEVKENIDRAFPLEDSDEYE